MGMAYQELEKLQKATTSFELALKADSSNIAAMNNLANTLKSIGQYVKAEKIYKKILEINPSYINAYNNYGNLKSEVNDIEGAIRLYNQALVIAKEKKINPIVILNHLST